MHNIYLKFDTTLIRSQNKITIQDIKKVCDNILVKICVERKPSLNDKIIEALGRNRKWKMANLVKSCFEITGFEDNQRYLYDKTRKLPMKITIYIYPLL